jgi:hypothetical protein
MLIWMDEKNKIFRHQRQGGQKSWGQRYPLDGKSDQNG